MGLRTLSISHEPHFVSFLSQPNRLIIPLSLPKANKWYLVGWAHTNTIPNCFQRTCVRLLLHASNGRECHNMGCHSNLAHEGTRPFHEFVESLWFRSFDSPSSLLHYSFKSWTLVVFAGSSFEVAFHDNSKAWREMASVYQMAIGRNWNFEIFWSGKKVILASCLSINQEKLRNSGANCEIGCGLYTHSRVFLFLKASVNSSIGWPV